MIAGSRANETYDRLWAEAVRHFRSNRVEIDPYLLDKDNDRRQGLTVIGRPGSAISQRFVAFLEQIRRVAPEQYFYQTGDLHLTILSLFTATEAFEPHWQKLATYQAATADGEAFEAPTDDGVTAVIR